MSELPEDQVDKITERMAEEIVEHWRSFRESPRRQEIKEKIRVKIARAIVDELMVTTHDERFPPQVTCGHPECAASVHNPAAVCLRNYAG